MLRCSLKLAFFCFRVDADGPWNDFKRKRMTWSWHKPNMVKWTCPTIIKPFSHSPHTLFIWMSLWICIREYVMFCSVYVLYICYVWECSSARSFFVNFFAVDIFLCFLKSLCPALVSVCWVLSLQLHGCVALLWPCRRQRRMNLLSEFMSSCEELKLHMAKGRLYVKRITNMKKVAVI